ncbi:hypothetical protein C7H19_10945 [Aphanothece hegewaldii CCALA 016]|uniref:Uncharacterized protein n=1 Tax=Aphanothece hegewaldii CCALA 016 TaxID=2107694 RepID=A0A2T1LXW2_9CHRO|nr:hypothetical protein [Aphanothece hegewaldii]PSF37230.1 hypothetical protein C7H19_10945 [Aphanothece hegewaldii CCALA 016]
MFGKINQISLVSTVLLSLMAWPTDAKNVIIQRINQNVSVSGNNNQVYQIINQTIINNPRRNQVNRDDKKEKNNPGRALGHSERTRQCEDNNNHHSD